jgi:hypothetical protein
MANPAVQATMRAILLALQVACQASGAYSGSELGGGPEEPRLMLATRNNERLDACMKFNPKTEGFRVEVVIEDESKLRGGPLIVALGELLRQSCHPQYGVSSRY